MGLENFIDGYLMVVASIPLTLIIGLTGIKIYSWGRQTLLEKESSESVQKE